MMNQTPQGEAVLILNFFIRTDSTAKLSICAWGRWGMIENGERDLPIIVMAGRDRSP